MVKSKGKCMSDFNLGLLDVGKLFATSISW